MHASRRSSSARLDSCSARRRRSPPRPPPRTSRCEVSFAPDASVRLRGQRFVAATRAAARRRSTPSSRATTSCASSALFERVRSEPRRRPRARLLAGGERDVPDLNRHYRIVAAGPRRARPAAGGPARAGGRRRRRSPSREPPPPPATRELHRRAALRLRGARRHRRGRRRRARRRLGPEREDRRHRVLVEHARTRISPRPRPARSSPTARRPTPFNDTNHGTAVLGELIATANGVRRHRPRARQRASASSTPTRRRRRLHARQRREPRAPEPVRRAT